MPQTRRKQTTARRKPARGTKRWSARVTERSNALDLGSRIFAQRSPPLHDR